MGTLSRRAFLARGVSLAGVASGLYAWQIEPHWVEVVRHPMPLEYLPAALEGRTLLQLSDLHVGPRVDDNAYHFFRRRSFRFGTSAIPRAGSMWARGECCTSTAGWDI